MTIIAIIIIMIVCDKHKIIEKKEGYNTTMYIKCPVMNYILIDLTGSILSNFFFYFLC